MERVKQAIESGYEAHIASLYEVLTQSMMLADGKQAEISAAQKRFRQGLVFAAQVRQCAMAAASQD